MAGAMTNGRMDRRLDDDPMVLVTSTLLALERAGLRDMIAEVKRRVLELPVHFTSECVEDRMRLKPVVDLLFCEVRAVAREPHLKNEDRRERIKWALLLAGY